MHDLSKRVLGTIRKQALMKAGNRVAAAVSGGADSVALLLLLLDLRSELGIVLSVAHVNHRLRGEESDADEEFVKSLSERHGLDLYSTSAPLPVGASGIEATARQLRYDFFRRMARENRITKIATAHTRDDQAETVLLRILRGTGIRGLSGIHPRLVLAQSEGVPLADGAEVIRPLLTFQRDELREFLRFRKQPWREDSTNSDPGFLRNRIRHEVLPFISTLSSSVTENLADLAEIARVEEEHWTTHPEVKAPLGALDLTLLSSVTPASQRRLVMNWIHSNAPGVAASFRLVEEILELTQSSPGTLLKLPVGYQIRRSQRQLHLEPQSERSPGDEYAYALTVPGSVEVRELGLRIEAAMVDPATLPEVDRPALLDSSRLWDGMTVRNWHPGDRFWPAYTKEPKKVKDLLNARRVLGPEKKLWPVICVGDELVWMRGFPTPAALQPTPTARTAIVIRECDLQLGARSSWLTTSR